MTVPEIARLLARHHLGLFGGFHATPQDDLPAGTQTVLLLGPAEPGFWPHVTAEPEWDGKPDPLDRWSRRVIGQLASDLGARALFPFGGPPHRPFYHWALRTGRAFRSPVVLLVHDTAGLMVSYRGALALPEQLALPATGPSPCGTCDGQPCRTACIPGALTTDGYHIAKCIAFIDTPAGGGCMNSGCTVRRACPLSRRYARVPEQSAYHMRQFHQ